MHITVVLIQSLNGLITDTQGLPGSSWGSREDKVFFKELTTRIGTLIMGSKTFLTLNPKVLTTRNALVFTQHPDKLPQHENVSFYKGTPKGGLKKLADQGIESAVVIGGADLISQFLVAGLVDELYITVAPYIFSSGLTGLSRIPGKINMELISAKVLSGSEVLLHYRFIPSGK